MRFSIRSRARVNVAVSNASLCCVILEDTPCVLVIKKCGQCGQINVCTSSARSVRDAIIAMTVSNCEADIEVVSMMPYSDTRAALVNFFETVAQEATAWMERWDITLIRTSSGRLLMSFGGRANEELESRSDGATNFAVLDSARALGVF